MTVFLSQNEGAFSGILTKVTDKSLVFEQCSSAPTREGETVTPYKGRTIIDRDKVNYYVDAS